MKLLSACLVAAITGCAGIVGGMLYVMDDANAMTAQEAIIEGMAMNRAVESGKYFDQCTEAMEFAGLEMAVCERRLLKCQGVR